MSEEKTTPIFIFVVVFAFVFLFGNLIDKDITIQVKAKEIEKLRKQNELLEQTIKQEKARNTQLEKELSNIKKELERVKEEAKKRERTVRDSSSKTARTQSFQTSRGWNKCLASTYGIGDGFLGRRTANGEVLNSYDYTLAMRPSYRRAHGLRFGDYIYVSYRGKTVRARINDSGPFVGSRMIDLGPAVSRALGFSGVDYVLWKR